MIAMLDTLTLSAPAKLNLFLRIIGRRDDGYHQLQTLFQLLDSGDVITLQRRDDDQITLAADRLDIPLKDNLALRAAQRLRQATGVKQGCSIDIEKRLPMGAGLGGGSSDAATTLVGLNALWNCQLSSIQLAAIGADLGADIPAFVHGNSALGQGIGERLRPITLPTQWYLVVTPPVQVSTAEIFSHPELTRNSPPIKMCALDEERIALCMAFKNDCQALVEELYTEVRVVVEWLKRHATPQMSGTGASVFCCFDSRDCAEKVLQQVPPEWPAFVARGVNRSPVFHQLKQQFIGASPSG